MPKWKQIDSGRQGSGYAIRGFVPIVIFVGLVACSNDITNTSSPIDDENLAFVKEDGFTQMQFVRRCRAIGDDGAVIDDESLDTLPVGGGYSLECLTDPIRNQATHGVDSSRDEPWCVLGEISSNRAHGPDGVKVTIAKSPKGKPWTFLVTRDGESTNVSKIPSLGGGSQWPFYANLNMTVTGLRPNPSRGPCDELFGL